jgi:alpha-1,3-rhamnosyltransferase
MNQIKLTVVVLSYNHEKYIIQCLHSIVEQKNVDFFLVLMDNDSIDESFLLGKTYLQNTDRKFIAHKFDKNIGASRAFNYALDNFVKTEYVSFIAADDWLDLSSFEKKIILMDKDASATFCYSKGSFFLENDNKIVQIEDQFNSTDFVYENLLKRSFICMMGTVFRTHALHDVGGFVKDNMIEDWDIFLRLSKGRRVLFLDEFLFYYRRHNSNMSAGSLRYFNDAIRILDDINHKNVQFGYLWVYRAYLLWIVNEVKNNWQFSSFIVLLSVLRKYCFWRTIVYFRK